MPLPIFLRPATGWHEAAHTPAQSDTWTALRGPALVALVFGCAASLLSTGTLTPRVAVPAAAYWTFVPAVELAALYTVCAAMRRARPRGRAIDLFFRGHAPWLLWLIGFSAFWALHAPQEAFAVAAKSRAMYYTAIAVAIWSGYIDYWFFRGVLDSSPRRAALELAGQRAIAWTIGILIFIGPSAFQVAAARLGL